MAVLYRSIWRVATILRTLYDVTLLEQVQVYTCTLLWAAGCWLSHLNNELLKLSDSFDPALSEEGGLLHPLLSEDSLRHNLIAEGINIHQDEVSTFPLCRHHHLLPLQPLEGNGVVQQILVVFLGDGNGEVVQNIRYEEEASEEKVCRYVSNAADETEARGNDPDEVPDDVGQDHQHGGHRLKDLAQQATCPLFFCMPIVVGESDFFGG